MELFQDFKELLQLLNKNNVEYLIVGGYAVAFHGHPRFTGDLDIYVNPTTENATKILISLKEFGFGALGLAIDEFTIEDNVIQLGYPPVRIDLLTSISGIKWEKAFENKKDTIISGIKTSFISVDDLILNKKATNRPQDIADIISLSDK